jgi:RNA polymerase sigma factor (sigma-70 family)
MAAEPEASRKSDQPDRDVLLATAGRYLKNLQHFVRHELAYLQAVGDLLPAELTPEDVVDGVLLRAYRELAERSPERKVKSWLIRLAREHLEAEVRRAKSWRSRTPRRLEEDVAETPRVRHVFTLGDEILDFYLPDEDLKLEDIIPDLEVPTPEEEAETQELRRCASAALAALPRDWRRALLLSHVEELSGPELARAVGRPEPEVRRIVEYARQYLRDKLVESGFTLRSEAG